MAATRKRARPLSSDETARLIALMKNSDSVELKLTVPESEHRSTVSALDIDPIDAEIRQVVFFDTPDLTLYEHGVVVRARRVQRKGDDSVVKLRPVVPSELPARVRKSSEFGVEVDAMPGGFVCSGSMKGIPQADVRKAVAGKKRVDRLLTKPQRAFYADHAPDGSELDDLSVLGPIFVLKLKFAPKAFDRRLVAEMWLYPDNSRILEALDQVRPRRGIPGCCGDTSIPRGTRRRPRRRAGDEDAQGARVLLGATPGDRRGGVRTSAVRTATTTAWRSEMAQWRRVGPHDRASSTWRRLGRRYDQRPDVGDAAQRPCDRSARRCRSGSALAAPGCA